MARRETRPESLPRDGLPPTWYWTEDGGASEFPGVYGAPVASLSDGRRDWIIVRAWAIYTITPLSNEG